MSRVRSTESDATSDARSGRATRVVRQAKRPVREEFDPFYATYVEKVPEGDVVEVMRRQGEACITFLRGIPEEERDEAYAPDKWTLKEVVGHLADAERLFGYRVMVIARGDQTPLPGMDETAYMSGDPFAGRSWDSLVDELEALRRSNVELAASFGDEILDRRGVADSRTISVRALLYVIVGHELHHRSVIRRRYLGDEPLEETSPSAPKI